MLLVAIQISKVLLHVLVASDGFDDIWQLLFTGGLEKLESPEAWIIV